MKAIITEDNTLTYFSETYQEPFHSRSGARNEAQKKFAEPAILQTELSKRKNINLLDIGFGLGYNSAETIRLLIQKGNCTSISVTAIEKDSSLLTLAKELHKNDNNKAVRTFFNQLPKQNFSFYEQEINIEASFILKDAREAIQQLKEGAHFDIILLDGFSTRKNPELWSYDFLQALLHTMTPSGILVTYSCAYPVVSALLNTGAYIYQTEPEGRKSGGLAASHIQRTQFRALDTTREAERKNTTGTIFFRDPQLNRSSDQILQEYEKERQQQIKNGTLTIRQYRQKMR